jgi:hypothetical protein
MDTKLIKKTAIITVTVLVIMAIAGKVGMP